MCAYLAYNKQVILVNSIFARAHRDLEATFVFDALKDATAFAQALDQHLRLLSEEMRGTMEASYEAARNSGQTPSMAWGAPVQPGGDDEIPDVSDLELLAQASAGQGRFFPAGPGMGVGGGATMVSENLWMYLDDWDQAQGPFPESLMRQWLAAGYFDHNTMVRCASCTYSHIFMWFNVIQSTPSVLWVLCQ